MTDISKAKKNDANCRPIDMSGAAVANSVTVHNLLTSPLYTPRKTERLTHEIPVQICYDDQIIRAFVHSVVRFDNGNVHSILSANMNGVSIQHSIRDTLSNTKVPMQPVPAMSREKGDGKWRIRFQGAHKIQLTSKDGLHVKHADDTPTYVFRSRQDFHDFQGELLQKIVLYTGDVELISAGGKILCEKSSIRIAMNPNTRKRSIIYFRQGIADGFEELPASHLEISGSRADMYARKITLRSKNVAVIVPHDLSAQVSKLGLAALSEPSLKPAKSLNSMPVTSNVHPSTERSMGQKSMDGYSYLVINFYLREDSDEFRKRLTSKDSCPPLRMNLCFQLPREQSQMAPPAENTKSDPTVDHGNTLDTLPRVTQPPTKPWCGQGMNIIKNFVQSCMDMDVTGLSDLEPPGGLSTPLSRKKLSFHVHWSISQFMQNQFGDVKKDLGSVIVLVGSAIQAEATTVEEYCTRTWPGTSYALLRVVESLQNQRRETSWLSRLKPEFKARFPQLFLFGNDNVICDVLNVEGSEEEIVEIAQQLVFLGSAFATSTTGKISRSQGNISLDEYDELHITFRVDELPDQEGCCWHDLFVDPVIVYNFPIAVSAARSFTVGLEIPIEMMAVLGGAVNQVEYAGGILIKGFSSMFVPVKRVGDYVQWHYIYNEDGSRLPYWEADKRCPARALLDRVDKNIIKSSRAVLGWWGNVTTLLGSSDVDYQSIGWTGLKEPTRSAAFTGGSIGFQMFGTGELNFSVGPKDSKLHISRPGSYQRIVKHASNTPVILFDPDEGDRRAWLVPASSLIAHIAQTRHFRSNFMVDDIAVHIIPTETNLNVFEAAEKMLCGNAATILSHDPWDLSTYYFRDLVLGVWSLLETIMDQDCKLETSADPVLHRTTLKEIRGWEYMDLVAERSPLRRKESVLKKTSGNWTDLARDLNAIVLLANGFGDLMLPRQTEHSGLCDGWNRVPRGKDYLTASVPILRTISEQAGSGKYLTSTHLQWHRGRTLFEKCSDIQHSEDTCSCDRVQQILPESRLTFGKIIPPGPLPTEGAVVFGQSRNAFILACQESMNPAKPDLPSERRLSILSNLGFFPKKFKMTVNLDPENNGFVKPSSRMRGKESKPNGLGLDATVASAETEVD